MIPPRKGGTGIGATPRASGNPRLQSLVEFLVRAGRLLWSRQPNKMLCDRRQTFEELGSVFPTVIFSPVSCYRQQEGFGCYRPTDLNYRATAAFLQAWYQTFDFGS